MQTGRKSYIPPSEDHDGYVDAVPSLAVAATPPKDLSPSPGGEQAPSVTPLNPIIRHHRRDPYRNILPRKMSLQTASGVVAGVVRPRANGSFTVNPAAAAAAADEARPPTAGKKGSSRRKVSKTLTLKRDKQSLGHLEHLVASSPSSDYIYSHSSKVTHTGGRKVISVEKIRPRPGTNTDTMNSEGYAALHLAAQSNHLGWIHELFEHNADVNISSVEIGFTPLHLAARYGCLEAVRALLKHGADCDASTSIGQRAIHLACRRGHLEITEVLLESSKDQAKVSDNDRMTPLHMAAIDGNVDICQLLINNGADVIAREIRNATPLIIAASGGHRLFAEWLLLAGLRTCDLLADADNEGSTVLHIAVSNGHYQLVKFLLHKGADVNCQKSTGFAPLHMASILGNVDICRLLLDYGASVAGEDNEVMTPLHRAALYNRKEVVELLVKNGADINAREKDDFTPLLCACWRGHSDLALLLIRKGADMTLHDGELKTCIHWAVEMGFVDLVRSLFDEGAVALMESADRSDQTPLHYAAEIGNVALVSFFILNGARGDIRDIEEKAPLHIAAQVGRLSCVKTLLTHFPNLLNEDDVDGMTPLLLASQNGHYRVVKYLLRVGADIASKDDSWRTALALAVGNNYGGIVTLLIEHQADINVKDKEKNTPLHLACRAGHAPVAKQLLTAGAEMNHQNTAGLYTLDEAIKSKHIDVTKAIVTSRQWRAAMANCNSQGLTPMKALIEEMPDAALTVLDHCVHRSSNGTNHQDYEITYDYSYIDPGPDSLSTRNTTFMGGSCRFFGLQSMVKHNREKLLSHELSQNILSRKLVKFAGLLYALDVLIYLIFVGCLFHYTISNQLITSEDQLDSMGCISASANDSAFIFDSEGRVKRVTNVWLITSQIFMSLYCGYIFVIKLIQLLQKRLAFMFDISNHVVITLCVTCSIFVYPTLLPPCSLQWQAGIFTNFLAWITFILYLRPINYVGIYVGMFLTTLKSLIKAMAVYVFFIVAFGMSFYICFARLDSFHDPGTALLTTFVMTLGEIDQSDIFDTTSLAPFDNVAYILFVAFLFLMPMVLINLTIGISVGDIEGIRSTAYLQRLGILVNLVCDYESKLPQIMQRKVYESSFTARPNKKAKEKMEKVREFLFANYASPKVKDTIISKLKMTNNAEALKELQHVCRSVSSMGQILEKHTDILRRLSEKLDIADNLDYQILETEPMPGVDL